MSMKNNHVKRDPTTLRILFVCTGNTCRSPMAEGIAKGLLGDRAVESVEVRSAGTHAADGSPASGGALRAATRHGWSLESHRSTFLSGDLVDWADLILVMGPGHLHQVERLGGGEKVALLGEYASGESGDGSGMSTTHLAIPDPFGGNDARYEQTYQTLDRYVTMALRRLSEGSEG